MSSFRMLSLAILGFGAMLAAQPAWSEEVTLADVGRDQFQRYCSACHGPEGKGDGPFVPYLKTPPPDLTTLAKRNGGKFPDIKVADIVDGRTAMPAHGTGEMPIWGQRFGQTMKSPMTGAAVRGEIALFVAYLRSIQQK